jgi:diketogulonate reductase-like aldo/keto reductase
MTKFNINSTVRMNSGYDIPLLGYGVYQTPIEVAEQVTAHAVKSGYRHADSAAAYRNEQATAAGMLKTGIPRSQLFFTSKVPPKAINYDDARKVVDESLRLTGLEYIDLYLLHAPYGGKENRLGAWKALVEAVEAGKVRSIGVSNYGVHHLEELDEWIKQTDEKECQGKGGVLSVNQVELHPWLARDDIVDWCTKRGIVMEVGHYNTFLHQRKLIGCSLGLLSSGSCDKDRRSSASATGQKAQQDYCSDPTTMGFAKGSKNLHMMTPSSH